MAFLKAEALTKHYNSSRILDNIEISLEKEAILAVLGRSGCGKTTLLKILAGLITPDSGTITVEGKPLQRLSLRERGIIYLYQEALLFPHLTVAENIAFGLRVRNYPLEEIKKQTLDMLENLQLSAFSEHMPIQLSGGQKQRVALGRALLVQPRLLLLDEPFGALDPETRSSMQLFFKDMAKKHRITAIFVTHDLKEAVNVGHQWALMENGRLQIYEQLEHFAAERKTGLQQEIEYWKKLDSEL